jgi:type II secretory pathway predicted ATPase ExeA
MIRTHFGLETNPFDPREPQLLPHQQEILDTLLVHARQGGLCIVMGEPGTGKSIIKQTLIKHDPKRIITPSVSRTLHTYSNTLQILCEAFGIEAKGRDTHREKQLIEAAWETHTKGRLLVPIIDDAHLMHIDCLRKIRLLLEDFPRSHNLLLVAQPPLIHKLRLIINDDIRSRITYSVHLKPLAPDDTQTFILDQLDRCGLPHSVFTDDARALIVRSSEGVLRRVRNLCVGTLLETVRDRKREAGLEQVNRILMQPHWRKEHDVTAH